MSRFPPTPWPVKDATASYWLSQTSSAVSNFCSRSELPEQVDTVIIGSGITGVLIAHELLLRSASEKPSILIVEARGLASGATGRNGGHIKPDSYKNYLEALKHHDAETAKALASYEPQNMRETVQFIKEAGLESAIDLVELRSTDVFMTEDAWNEAVASYNAFGEAGGDISETTLHDAKEAREKFRVNGVFGAVSYPAYSLWPHKLATRLLEKAVQGGVDIFTNTLVTKVDRKSEKSDLWKLSTTRGDVTCAKVYHATNGYAASLLPGLRRAIVPVKGHVAAIEPTESYASRPLENTYGVQWGEDFDYLIQRPNDGKPLIYGGRDLAHKDGLPGVIGDSDDSKTTPEIVRALATFPFQYFTGWDQPSSVRCAWSGIMGFTADGLPYIGELPGLPGQYIAAGFNGHGMARVFLCARAVVQLSCGEEVDSRIPQPYLNISARLSHLSPQWEDFLDKAEYARSSKKPLKSLL